ncbi:hypothetical protein PRJ_Fausto_00099 [Faustovirus]|nr:hypothetical protein PRJ_Fausto_00099 [Faustovirus]QBR99013.1 hypothetical protein [Faustovirus mariensis]
MSINDYLIEMQQIKLKQQSEIEMLKSQLDSINQRDLLLNTERKQGVAVNINTPLTYSYLIVKLSTTDRNVNIHAKNIRTRQNTPCSSKIVTCGDQGCVIKLVFKVIAGDDYQIVQTRGYKSFPATGIIKMKIKTSLDD